MSRQPHILHISTTFNLRSGSAKRTLQIMNACLEKGYKVSLICGQSNDIDAQNLSGINVVVVSSMKKPVSLVDDVRSFVRLIKCFKKAQPDIVHTHLAKAGILGRFAARWAGVKVILHTVHGPTFSEQISRTKSFVFLFAERLAAKVTDVFVYVGQELSALYSTAGIKGKYESVVIRTARSKEQLEHSMLDQESRSQLISELTGKKNPGMILAIVGRLVPAKQQHDAIEVLAKLRGRGVSCCLLIVGEALDKSEDSYKAKLIHSTVTHAVSEHVYFTGFRSNILDIMDAADILLLTSKYEGLPNIAVEAILAETILVSYVVPGIKKLVLPELVVPNGDVDSLVEKVIYGLDNRPVLCDKIKRIKENLLKVYTVDRMTSAKLNLYQSLLSNYEE